MALIRFMRSTRVNRSKCDVVFTRVGRCCPGNGRNSKPPRKQLGVLLTIPRETMALALTLTQYHHCRVWHGLCARNAGQSTIDLCKKGTRAVDLLRSSACHRGTVCSGAGKEAISAVSSLRKLSSGATATPTAVLASSFRKPTSLTTYQGSLAGYPTGQIPHIVGVLGTERVGATSGRLVAEGGNTNGKGGGLLLGYM